MSITFTRKSTSKSTASNQQSLAINKIIVACLALVSLTLMLPSTSQAQSTIPPSLSSGTPSPIAPGDGQNAPLEIPGDVGQSTPAPSGNADNTTGNFFPTTIDQNRTMVFLYKYEGRRGQRAVMILSPSQMTSAQANQISGILGTNILSGQAVIKVMVTDSQLAAISSIQQISPMDQQFIISGLSAPSSSGITVHGKRQIKVMRDPKDAEWLRLAKPQDVTNLYNYGRRLSETPLPTVRIMARYLVILAVVVATVWIAFASTSMIMGDSHGGERVIAGAAGLMLMLAAYTIYKIVMLNSLHSNSTIVNRVWRPIQGIVPVNAMQLPDTPDIPPLSSIPTRPVRAGAPVQPDSGI